MKEERPRKDREGLEKQRCKDFKEAQRREAVRQSGQQHRMELRSHGRSQAPIGLNVKMIFGHCCEGRISEILGWKINMVMDF